MDGYVKSNFLWEGVKCHPVGSGVHIFLINCRKRTPMICSNVVIISPQNKIDFPQGVRLVRGQSLATDTIDSEQNCGRLKFAESCTI